MSNCGRKGRCCHNGQCSDDVGVCQCQSCGNGQWHMDNSCLPGACWIVVDGTFVCEQLNPCECEYRGGEFNGPGTLCPDSGEGPPPPPPPPPPGEEPGPVLVYCCNRDIGSCVTREYTCLSGETRYWSAASCDRNCQQSGPDPDPDPDPDPPQPCDPACDACSDCDNGVCRDRCAAGQVCCNGTCCPPGQLCVDGVCVPQNQPCGDECTWLWQPDGFVWNVQVRACSELGCDCAAPTSPPPNPTTPQFKNTPCNPVNNPLP